MLVLKLRVVAHANKYQYGAKNTLFVVRGGGGGGGGVNAINLMSETVLT